MSTLSQKIDVIILKMDLLHSNSTEMKTPEALVNEMLDKLPIEIWQDRTKTFLDPACGRGIFGLLILKRLFDGLQSVIPDEQERVNHILGKQIFLCDISPVMCMKATAVFERAIKAAALVNPGVHIYNKDSLEHKFNMKFDVVIGNPPYQAPCGYKTPAIYKDVDGKHGKKQLYYFFTKLGVNLLNKNGLLLFVQPTCWRTNDDAVGLRRFLCKEAIHVQTSEVPAGGEFVGVMTSADIQLFQRIGEGKQFHGPNNIYTTTEWQRAWLDTAADGHLLEATRGGFKEDKLLPPITVYETYKLGVVTAARRVKQVTKAGKLIIFPEFLAPHRNNFQKANIVEAAPFSDCFIGIEATNAESIMSWIQSKPFHKAMSWLKGSSHGGSLCQYFITEDAYNKYVREHYEAEERIPHKI